VDITPTHFAALLRLSVRFRVDGRVAEVLWLLRSKMPMVVFLLGFHQVRQKPPWELMESSCLEAMFTPVADAQQRL